jgi:hypothetical protein
MEIQLFDFRHHFIQVVSTEEMLAIAQEATMMRGMRFFGTREVLVVVCAPSQYKGLRVFNEYTTFVEGNLLQENLVVAGHFFAHGDQVVVEEWGSESLDVFTDPNMLDDLMTLIGATDEGRDAKWYRANQVRYEAIFR